MGTNYLFHRYYLVMKSSAEQLFSVLFDLSFSYHLSIFYIIHLWEAVAFYSSTVLQLLVLTLQ
uniref:Uncharacterized protein n=1 Tax=Arundo donax TaxID=35708 RepID=A0A0A9FFV7_ARUDO